MSKLIISAIAATIFKIFTFLKKGPFNFHHMDKTRKRITDIPEDELRKDMEEYAKKHSSSVRAARKYLRGLGMKIDNRGYVIR